MMGCPICRRYALDRVIVDREIFWIGTCKNGKTMLICLKEHGREPTDEEYKTIMKCTESTAKLTLGWQDISLVYNNESDHWYVTAKEAWWLKK